MYLWHAQPPHILVPIHLGYAIKEARIFLKFAAGSRANTGR